MLLRAFFFQFCGALHSFFLPFVFSFFKIFKSQLFSKPVKNVNVGMLKSPIIKVHVIGKFKRVEIVSHLNIGNSAKL